MPDAIEVLSLGIDALLVLIILMRIVYHQFAVSAKDQCINNGLLRAPFGTLGAAIEIDLERTLQRVEREGVLLQPVLRPRRVNHARLLILADEGGSMAPFRAVIAPLLSSAQTVGFARTGVYYFHDIPESNVFAKPWLGDPVPLPTACHPFHGAEILIVSDAGAADSGTDAGSVDAGPVCPDGGALTMHQDGLGDPFFDCAPLGTYNGIEAQAACSAHKKSPCAANYSCAFQGGDTEECDGFTPPCNCWGYSTGGSGTVGVGHVNTQCLCASNSDPTWQ